MPNCGGTFEPASSKKVGQAAPEFVGETLDGGTFSMAQHRGEWVFVNFFATEGTTFDRIVFFESPTVGGYESDNHTVGFYTSVGGIPEPATWAMMILGFGLVGVAARRRSSMATRTLA